MLNHDKEKFQCGHGRGIAWMVALIVFIIIAFCWIMNRTTLASFSTPLGYGGDGFLVLANAKAYMDGDAFPVIHKWVSHLNAPLTANWNDWPITEELIFATIGWTGRVTGLFIAANIALAMCHLLAGVSFWLVGKELKLKGEYIFLGAFAYSFSNYIFSRGIPHIVLSMYWHLPWVCLISWWAFDKEPMDLSNRRGRIALLVSLITGALNPYYTWMYVHFIAFAIIKNIVNKNIKRATYLFALVVITLSVFTLFNMDTLTYKWANGANTEAVTRNLSGLELYGLKLPELFLPSSHRWAVLNHFASDHYYSRALIRGEIGGTYLGMLGIVGLLSLMAHGLYNILRNRPYRVSLAWWQVIWVTLYSLVGGVNLILGSFGLVLFRGTNRFSIVILTLSLLFLVQLLSKSCSWRFSRGLAIMCIPLVLWDQFPLRYSSEQLAMDSVKFESDRSFSRQLESALPNGAMVFQLPPMAYPEVPSIVKMADYEHFRPYLHTTNLHYSYGTNKGRGDAEWQNEVSDLPLPAMLARLEKYGFDSLMVNRNGYADHAVMLVKGLREAGKAIISENSDMIAFKLNPELNLIPSAITNFYSGWSTAEIGRRWAISKTARIVVNNLEGKVRMHRVCFSLSGLQSQKISIKFNGKSIQELSLRSGESEAVMLPLELAVGENTLLLESDVVPALPGNGDRRLLAFSVEKYEVE